MQTTEKSHLAFLRGYFYPQIGGCGGVFGTHERCNLLRVVEDADPYARNRMRLSHNPQFAFANARNTTAKDIKARSQRTGRRFR